LLSVQRLMAYVQLHHVIFVHVETVETVSPVALYLLGRGTLLVIHGAVIGSIEVSPYQSYVCSMTAFRRLHLKCLCKRTGITQGDFLSAPCMHARQYLQILVPY